MNQNGVEASEDMNEEADFINSRAKFGLMVNWRSMFSELFTDENMEIRENFRTCSNVLTSRVRSKNCIPIRKDQWAQAETAWYQIEHRLRAVVVRSFEKEEFCLFVQALEAVLLFFLSQGKAPASHLIPEALSVQLEVPLDVSDSSLSIVLKNSSFHRLLLHAACQFYGLRSKVNYLAFNYLHDTLWEEPIELKKFLSPHVCFLQSTNDSNGTRKTIITPSAAARGQSANSAIHENLSLVGYVLAVKLQNLAPPPANELSLQSLRISNLDRPADMDDVVVEI